MLLDSKIFFENNAGITAAKELLQHIWKWRQHFWSYNQILPNFTFLLGRNCISSDSQLLGSSREHYRLWNLLYSSSLSHSRSTSKPCQQKLSILTFFFFTVVWNEKAWNTLLEACHSKQRKYQTGKTRLFSCSKANTTRGLHSISLSEIPISQFLVTQLEGDTFLLCYFEKKQRPMRQFHS